MRIDLVYFIEYGKCCRRYGVFGHGVIAITGDVSVGTQIEFGVSTEAL